MTGKLYGVGGLAAAVAAGVFGRFSDAWGHKRLLIACTMAAGGVALLHAFAQSLSHLYALRVLSGLAAAGIMPSANAIIRNITHDRNLGRAYGATSSIGSLGMAFGPLVGGYLAAGKGLRAPFVLTSVVLGLAALLVAWRVRPQPPQEGSP